MGALRAILIRITGTFGGRRRRAAMEEEFRAHLQMDYEENRRRGMSPEEARRMALMNSGGLTMATENVREQSGLPFLETLFHDLRYGWRTLRATPGFTIVAVLTLALGIGANTAIFSVINAVLLSPLPFRDQDRLVQLWETESAPGSYPFAGPDYIDWEVQSKTLEATAAYNYPNAMNASNGADAQPVIGCPVEASFFNVIGVSPMMGRTFTKEENQSAKSRVAVITYGFWQKFYGGSSDVLSKKLTLDGEAYDIIGVMPKALNFPSRTQVYLPKDMTTTGMRTRGQHWFRAIGKLKPGETVASAQAELSTIAANLEKQYPDSNEKVGAKVIALREQITGSSRESLLVLLGAVALVLLVACFNVANLLLARATGRLREIALRGVLGASRWRIIRQLLTESVLLSLMGAMLGLFGAWWCVNLIQNATFLPVPRTNPIALDATVLLFTAVVSVLVGIVFGLAPALQASRLDLGEELKSVAQSVLSPTGWNRRVRDLLVVGEIALSLALLTGAGLLIRSFQKMRAAETGVQAENVLTFATLLPHERYKNTPEQRAFFDQLQDRLSHSPGITGAAVATEIPLEGGNNGYIAIDGDPDPTHTNLLVEHNYVTPGYFAALGIPFIAGRNFSEQDLDYAANATERIIKLNEKDPNEKTPPDIQFTVIVSKKMADTFWPKEDSIGKSYHSPHSTTPYRVIGVVGDVSTWGVRQQSLPQTYHPFTMALGDSRAWGQVVVHSTLPAATLLSTVRNQLRQIDSSLAMIQPRTMQQVISENVQDAAVQTWLLGSFAALALLLAAVGLYSVLSYLVTQRTREIGIRMALGAQQNHVLKLVMGHAGTLTAMGIVAGVIGSLLLTRFLQSLLFGVSGRDPLTLAAVVAVLALVALIACYVPVRRAMKVDPLVALRYE